LNRNYLPGIIGTVISISLVIYAIKGGSLFDRLFFWLIIAMPLIVIIIFGIFYRVRSINFNGNETVIALDLQAKEEAWECVRRILKERMSSPTVQYYYVVSSSPNGYSSVTVVLNGRDDKVEIEKEVIKTTLNAACSGFRLSTRNLGYSSEILSLLKKLMVVDQGFNKLKIWSSSKFDLVLPTFYPYPINRDNYNKEVFTQYQEDVRITIGYSLNSIEPHEVAVTYSDIINRIGIFGSTGTGKSTTAALIITGLALNDLKHHFKVAVIDWHSEYPKLLNNMGFSNYKVIDFSRQDIRLGVFCYSKIGFEGVTELLSEALSLSDPQALLLTRIINEQKPISINGLIEYLNSSATDGYWSREIRHAILRKLYIINQSRYSSLFSSSCGNLDQLLDKSQEKILIFDMFKIKNTNLRRLIAFTIISNLYYTVRERGMDIILLLDEAQNLISNSSANLINTIVVEGRKFGLGLMLLTQNPSMLPKEIIANMNTKLVHAIRSGVDKKIIEESMSLTQEYVQVLDKLGQGEVLLQSHLYRKPVLARINPFLYLKLRQQSIRRLTNL